MTDESIAEQARTSALAKVRRARAMTAFEKFDAGASLFEEACAWSLAGITHQHPGWDISPPPRGTSQEAQTRIAVNFAPELFDQTRNRVVTL